MIPSIFVYLKEMPLNQNGKLDRLSLPEPKEKDLDKNKYEAPKTDIEKRIANIWQEVLNIKKIGLNDNFFNLGGHSLKAIQVLARINKEFDIDLGLKELFKENKKTAVIIPKTKKKEYYKLSYAQQKIFIWHKLDPDSYIYNLNIVLRLEEDIKIKQFKKAVAELAERHEVLRTRFLEINGEAVQMVGDKSIVKLQIQNISDSGSEEREMIEIEAAIEKIIRMPFNLKEEAPFRIAVFKHQNIISTTGQKKKEILIISIHHIAVDQWSMQMLIRELFKIYEACLKEEKPDLPKLSIQYKDYAEWEQSEENQKRLEAQKKYWLARLGENPPVSSLPLDYPRKSILEYKKGYVCDYLDNKIIDRLREMANSFNASLFMVFFAVFNVYISKLTAKKDIITGTSATQRDKIDLAHLIGYFSNDIPIRTKLVDNCTFEELLIQIKKNIHSGIINNQAISNDWGITFEIYKDKVRISSEYNASVLKEDTIKSWLSDLIHLIKQIAVDPEKRIFDYEAVSPENKKKLLKDFNNTYKRQPLIKAPHHYFEEQAKKKPMAIAAAYKKEKISYGELNNEANRLANCLTKKGIKKGETIAMDIGEDNYLEIPKLVLAIHKVGAVCLMIDREYPEERIEYILKKSKSRFVITDKPSRKSSAQGGSAKILYKLLMAEKSVKLKVFDITQKEELEKYSTDPQKHKGINGKDTAFIVFTSGTTGVPKGIKVTAKALVNEAYYKIKDIDPKRINAIPMNFSLQYTPAIEFISASFVLGKKLLIYSKQELYDAYAVLKKADENKLRYISMTPSVLNSYLEMIEDESNNKNAIPLKHLEIIDLIGEKTYPGLVKRFYAKHPHITLNSEYGSSESSSCVYGIIPKEKDLDKVKEGKTIRNQQVYILDNNQKPLPINATGEIYCSGYGLSNGYIGYKKQTEDKFLPHPFIKGEKIYRSGDKGSIDIEGNIEVKGRVDDQVKIRGQRVELDEIREIIKRMPEIQEVLVQARKTKNNYELDLVCYYTVKDNDNISIEDIKVVLERQIPKYMIPSYFIELKEFPLNQNGKINRDKLPKPKEKNLFKDKYEAPKTDTEKKVAIIWRDMLNIKRVGLNDDFFNLGGDSLKAIQFLAKINKEFKIDFSFRDIFRYSVFKKLVNQINKIIIEKNINF